MLRELLAFRVTYTLIFLNLLLYLATVYSSVDFIDMNVRVLVDFGALYGPLVVIYDEWWRLFSAMFLHSGLTHLLMNMFSLYIVGRAVELYFHKSAYLWIYFFSGLLGAIASLAVHPQSVVVGASGAIFGLFGALAGFFLVFREKIAKQSKEFMKSFGVLLALNLFLGLSIPTIDMSAHIGGLITGFVGGVILSRYPHHIVAYVMSMAAIFMGLIYYLKSLYVSIG